jgi:3-deoxy-manno-octulosonate cytidylyltransferase (CMP-KDO synthetase)
MSAVGLIPARYASTRFPGKPLALIDGVPMLERVWRAATECEALDRVIVATDDARIAELCEAIGALCVMTDADHPTGTDRIAQAARGLEAEIIVNIQGDEPLIEACVIEAAIGALRDRPAAVMATVAHLARPQELDDPNAVKVVIDRRGLALYFSRAAIPAPAPAAGVGAERGPCWRHIGLYAYRRDFLQVFVGLSRGAAERTEELEQLRALEHGYAIAVATIDGWCSASVDVPQDVIEVEKLLANRSGSA